MNKHGDQFLEMFRDSFGDFAPEVPASVYAGVKKKMFWSNFMGFNIAQLNIWYVLLATSSIALLGWSNLEQNSTGILASGSEYELKEFREPMMASVVSMPIEEVENVAIQFSPNRSTSTKSTISSVASSSKASCAGEEKGVDAGTAVAVDQKGSAEKVDNQVAAVQTAVQDKVIEEKLTSEVELQTNLPVNMGGSIIENSNLVEQLKKKDGPIYLPMHVKKTSTQEQ